ncbi:MAG: gamma-glutamylcyclotransferase [Verrucomicrobiales bacterium]|nr:gamma-glutamylcyclotransferase [Verrucomicrobiales bacterium]
MNIFVYGTLLFPEIRKMVGGRDFTSRAARVKGYQIFQVSGADFPGVVRAGQSHHITGEILYDLTPDEVMRMDCYEDQFYIRKTIEAEELDSGKKLAAEIYEIPEDFAGDILSNTTWTKQWFEENYYENFLNRLRSAYR